MNLFFVYDEYTDVANKSVVEYLAHAMINAFRNPHERPSGDHVLVQIVHQ